MPRFRINTINRLSFIQFGILLHQTEPTSFSILSHAHTLNATCTFVRFTFTHKLQQHLVGSNTMRDSHLLLADSAYVWTSTHKPVNIKWFDKINNYSVHCVRALLCASCEKKKKNEKCPFEKGRKGRTVRRVVCFTLQLDSTRNEWLPNGVVGWPNKRTEKADASKRVQIQSTYDCLLVYFAIAAAVVCTFFHCFPIHSACWRASSGY